MFWIFMLALIVFSIFFIPFCWLVGGIISCIVVSIKERTWVPFLIVVAFILLFIVIPVLREVGQYL